MIKSDNDQNGAVRELDGGSVPAFKVEDLASDDWRRTVTEQARQIDVEYRRAAREGRSGSEY